jgi:hypothetical protein
MASATRAADEDVAFGDEDLRAIQLQLGMLAHVATDYPLECFLGKCEFLFESRDEVQLLIESLTEEISESRTAA